MIKTPAENMAINAKMAKICAAMTGGNPAPSEHIYDHDTSSQIETRRFRAQQHIEAAAYEMRIVEQLAGDAT
jgi:hypothetical protein